MLSIKKDIIQNQDFKGVERDRGNMKKGKSH